ncbi:MAG: glycine zipper 2TM domain-containing protein [Sphingopyxis sp.]
MIRTLLLVGIAAIAAVSADAAYANHDGHSSVRTERRVIVVDGNNAEDAEVYRSADDRAPTEGDYRGRWNGQWNGTWESPEGQIYRGQYDGSYDPNAEGARHVTRPLYRDREGRVIHRAPAHRTGNWSDDDLSRMCRRDDGVGGGLIGGVVGGVAGNRIAGRGNRTAGTLIGAGVGAIAGSAIDRAEDRRACDDYWRRTDGRRYGAAYGSGDRRYDTSYGSGDRNYRDDHYRSGRHHRDDRYNDGGYESGYYGYDYIPGPATTIIIPGQPVIIEETETIYETVSVAAPRARVAPRRRVHRAAPRPRARARCSCR